LIYCQQSAYVKVDDLQCGTRMAQTSPTNVTHLRQGSPVMLNT
jgi:hypothetical protein